MTRLEIAILSIVFVQFVAMVCIDLLARKLHFQVKGTKEGYSTRDVVKNMDDFAEPANKELAQKIRILLYVSRLTGVTTVLLVLFYLSRGLGWL